MSNFKIDPSCPFEVDGIRFDRGRWDLVVTAFGSADEVREWSRQIIGGYNCYGHVFFILVICENRFGADFITEWHKQSAHQRLEQSSVDKQGHDVCFDELERELAANSGREGFPDWLYAEIVRRIPSVFDQYASTIDNYESRFRWMRFPFKRV